MYLLDTNVLSELRKLESNNCDTNVKAWFANCKPSQLHTSVICLLEVERGILQVMRKDTRQGHRLQKWFEHLLLPGLANRVHAVDRAVSRECAKLHVPNPRPELDSLIAATALVHDFIVVTRNTRDFEPMGVPCFNPWD
jgi:toxin FitB